MAETAAAFCFIKPTDTLSTAINSKANELYLLLKNYEAASLPIGDDFKNYFIDHHLGHRLFFSMENSAHIIYQSVKKSGKAISELTFIDYGAGLGTMYMLAGMLGFKRVAYNDYLPDWRDAAMAVSKAMRIHIDDFITGDIDDVLRHADEHNVRFDIVASRNVIEHIYNLSNYYKSIHQHNPQAIIFSTTTANFHNPAMWLKHYLLHKKIDSKYYLPHRKELIQKQWPEASVQQVNDLANKTRGKAGNDFSNAVNDYKSGNSITPVPFLYSNTCHAETGYWCEHIIKQNDYAVIIRKAGFKMDFTAGYWDTHYGSTVMNLLGKTLNNVVGLPGNAGCFFAPFVNVIAYN